MTIVSECTEGQRIGCNQCLIMLVMITLLVPRLITPISTPSAFPFNPDPPTVDVFRDGKQFAFMFSWDDDRLDLEFSYLEDMLNFKHTSFVVTCRMQSRKLWGLDMLFRGDDIQSHSREHLHHAQLNSSYRDFLFNQSVIDIEALFGYSPIILAYPYGSWNDQCAQQVLDYYQVARGISYESNSNCGSWPISNLGCCLHSFPSIHGVRGNNMENLIPSFERMVSSSDSEHRAYKCYGHTHWFSDSERDSFFSMLGEIAFRDDTWYTTWGEALAYQIQRDNVVVDQFTYNQDCISFRTSVDHDSSYGVALTYRVEIPESWGTISIIDDGRITNYIKCVKEDNKTFILFNSIPRGQTIEISSERKKDSVGPDIKEFRIIQTEEGVAFLVDVIDQEGYISDVNITISNSLMTYSFSEVRNPIFWSNSTYGRVVFNLPRGCYNFKVAALDSSQNIGESSKCFYVN